MFYRLAIIAFFGCIDTSYATKDSTQILKEIYNSNYARALEMAYGDVMLAEGGPEEIDFMFREHDLKGKKVLDFGSGLGGVAFHLARKYGAHVTGIELSPEMIASAKKRTPDGLNVEFLMTPDGIHLPCKDGSFDLVYSKGVNVHLSPEQLQAVLGEFHRVLKPGGLLVIGDWVSLKDDNWGPQMQALIESEKLPLFARTRATYLSSMQAAGFEVFKVTNRSGTYARYNRNILQRLTTEPVRSKFISQFGEKELSAHIKGYENIAVSNESGELFTLIFKARKLP